MTGPRPPGTDRDTSTVSGEVVAARIDALAVMLVC